MIAGLTTEDVRDALTVESIIDRYGLVAKRRGSQYRLRQCPRCGSKSSREAIAIDARTGSWCHHGFERPGGDCSGDILDLVAACEGLSCRNDFRRVLAIATEIAGVTDSLTEIERDQRREQAKERARRDVIAELEQRVAARSTAGDAWAALARSTPAGMAYLATRGLDAAALIARDAVRFATDGIVVAIRDADGCPVSTATRLYDPGDRPKVLALRGHSTRGTMVNATSQIRHDRDVIVTEGVLDTLTARVAWPTAVVLGANGAGNIRKVVEMAMIRVRLAGCHLWLVPHDDTQGISAVSVAGQIAIAAGLELDESLGVVDLAHKDLNDAWCAGWRP